MNIKHADGQQRHRAPYGLATWSEFSEALLSVLPWQEWGGQHWPFIPLLYSIIPSGCRCFFFLLQQLKKKSLLTTSKASLTLKRNPHPSSPFSCCGSKDGGYADCQLGVPTSAISTQRKTDLSKGNPEESAVLWRGHKMFYAAGLQRSYIAAFAGTFWRTKCYFKGS